MILDIIRHGEARWVAADVGLALVLVHAHVLHQYLRGKLHHGQFTVCQFSVAEVVMLVSGQQGWIGDGWMGWQLT